MKNLILLAVAGFIIYSLMKKSSGAAPAPKTGVAAGGQTTGERFIGVAADIAGRAAQSAIGTLFNTDSGAAPGQQPDININAD